MRIKSLLLTFVLTLALVVGLFAGCAKKTPTPTPTQPQTTTPQTSPPETTPNVTTSASIVDNEAAFLKAASSTGTWIIAITKDLTVTKDIDLAGEFKNGKKDANGKDIIQRKVALYAQDDNRNITARYTLTAPRMNVTSPEASIQHGTFKGDVYVSVKNFKLIDAKVDGNVYFTTDEAKATFSKDATSSVTGKTELKK